MDTQARMDDDGALQLPSLDDSIKRKSMESAVIMAQMIQKKASMAASVVSQAQAQAQDQSEQDDFEVLSAGEIMRAPLPMNSVLAMEDASGAQQGAYFIELMRRRLQGLLGVQEKWISRLCNQKHAKHVDTQLRIRDFMQAVIESYEARFGKPSESMISAAPIRRRRPSAQQRGRDLLI